MATSATAASAATQIGIQDFLKILVAQFGNQDPLKPMDNQEFVTQLAQFTSLQQTQEMNDKLGSMLTAQASMQSVGLLGRTVDVTTETGATSGTVTALSFTSGAPRLTVKTSTGGLVADINLASVTAVR
jgi:flagellar basal-body rod modification protein FlgD